MKGKKMRHFEYKDLGTNAHKFWEINLEAKKLVVTYGRIGIKNPASKVFMINKNGGKDTFTSREAAEKYCEKKLERKHQKDTKKIKI